MARLCFLGALLALAALATGSSGAVVPASQMVGGAARLQKADVAAAAAGRRLLRNETRVQAAIAFGTAAKKGDFPWIAVMVEDVEGDLYYANCAGILIRPRVVVTSAYCVSNPDDWSIKDILSVELGQIVAGDGGTEVAVQQVIRHPSFSPSTGAANDIALVILAKAATTVPIVKLAPASLKLRVGESLVIAGYGKTEQGTEQFIDKLKHAVAPFVATATCDKILEATRTAKISATQFCAGLGKNKQAGCSFDAGGPILQGMGRSATLVGIHSTKSGPTFKCGDKQNNFNGYTSIMALRPWLDAQFKALKV